MSCFKFFFVFVSDLSSAIAAEHFCRCFLIFFLVMHILCLCTNIQQRSLHFSLSLAFNGDPFDWHESRQSMYVKPLKTTITFISSPHSFTFSYALTQRVRHAACALYVHHTHTYADRYLPSLSSMELQSFVVLSLQLYSVRLCMKFYSTHPFLHTVSTRLLMPIIQPRRRWFMCVGKCSLNVLLLFLLAFFYCTRASISFSELDTVIR